MKNFVIGAPLGEGEFGKVYYARRKADNLEVAIKRLKQKFSDWEGVKNLRDVIASNSIPSHPNIVSTYEVHWDDATGILDLVMEYCELSLYDLMVQYMCQNKTMEEDLIRSLIQQILLGVQCCHQWRFCHRDIKPENVLLRRLPNGQWNCKLADFGLARRLPSPTGPLQTPMTGYVSTRWYRAPEIFLDDPGYSTPVDIFAVGCIMAELYESQPLFPGENELHQLYLLFNFLGAPHPSSWPDGYVLAQSRGLDVSSMHTQGMLHDILVNKVPAPPGCNSSAMSVPPRLIPPSRDGLVAVHNQDTNIVPRLSGSIESKPVSSHAFDLFRGLVVLNPSNRLSAEQALDHAFLQTTTGGLPAGYTRTLSPQSVVQAPYYAAPVVQPTPHRLLRARTYHEDEGIEAFFS